MASSSRWASSNGRFVGSARRPPAEAGRRADASANVSARLGFHAGFSGLLTELRDVGPGEGFGLRLRRRSISSPHRPSSRHATTDRACTSKPRSYAEYSLGLPHLWLYRPGPPLPATAGNPRSHVSEAPATTPYRLVEPRRTGDLRELTRSGSARAAYGCRTLSDRGRSTPAGGVPRLRWWCRRRVRGGRRSAAAASGACR